MKILAIESSCDETAAAVVENGTAILSSIIASSADMHAKTGGVIPEIAARQQLASILPVINQALEEAGETLETIDAIAVTIGPGLIGSLLVGVETAKTLSYLTQKPIIPVNHLLGHIYANWIDDKNENKNIEFPLLALVVSGGHTDLVLMKNHSEIEWIGGTRDDAAGEAFDKTARLLGLPYPGGPNLSKLADSFLAENKNASLNLFPRPLINEDNFDWSFSGLKTAVLRYVEAAKQEKKGLDKEFICAQVQEAIVDSLVTKTMKAIQKYNPKTFLLGGGVAANLRLKNKFSLELEAKENYPAFHVPKPNLCTDNAVCIASAAFFHNNPVSWKKVVTNPNLTIISNLL